MNIVILDESRFQQILTNPKMLEAFPFMRSAADALKVKSCKCSRATTARARDYANLKKTIAGMPAEKKKLFKTLLGAERVTMTYTNERRLLVEHSF